MRNRLRIPLLLAAVVLAGAAMIHPPADGTFRKDKAAVLLYGGLMDHSVLIARADTANLLDIVLIRTRGKAVPPESLADRPCVGVAIFTTTEWHVLTASGIPDGIPPEGAQTRFRFYPAIGDDPAVVQGGGILGGQTPWQLAAHVMGIESSLPFRVPAGTDAECDVAL